MCKYFQGDIKGILFPCFNSSDNDPSIIYSRTNGIGVSSAYNQQHESPYFSHTAMNNPYSSYVGNTQSLYSVNPIQTPNPYQLQASSIQQQLQATTPTVMYGNAHGAISSLAQSPFRPRYNVQMATTPNYGNPFLQRNNFVPVSGVGEYTSCKYNTITEQKFLDHSLMYQNQQHPQEFIKTEREMSLQNSLSPPTMRLQHFPSEDLGSQSEESPAAEVRNKPEQSLENESKKGNEESKAQAAQSSDNGDDDEDDEDVDDTENSLVDVVTVVEVENESKKERNLGRNDVEGMQTSQTEVEAKTQDEAVDLSVRPKSSCQKRKTLSTPELLNGKQPKTSELTNFSIPMESTEKTEVMKESIPVNVEEAKDGKMKILQTEGPQIEYASLIRKFAKEVEKQIDDMNIPNIPVPPAAIENGVIQIPVHLKWNKGQMEISCQIEDKEQDKAKEAQSQLVMATSGSNLNKPKDTCQTEPKMNSGTSSSQLGSNLDIENSTTKKKKKKKKEVQTSSHNANTCDSTKKQPSDTEMQKNGEHKTLAKLDKSDEQKAIEALVEKLMENQTSVNQSEHLRFPMNFQMKAQQDNMNYPSECLPAAEYSKYRHNELPTTSTRQYI